MKNNLTSNVRIVRNAVKKTRLHAVHHIARFKARRELRYIYNKLTDIDYEAKHTLIDKILEKSTHEKNKKST